MKRTERETVLELLSSIGIEVEDGDKFTLRGSTDYKWTQYKMNFDENGKLLSTDEIARFAK